MSDILLALFTVIQVASALVSLFLTFKPGISERTRQRAFHVLTAMTLLTGVAHLVTGNTLYGVVIIAVAILLPFIPRLANRWVRGREGETSKE